MDGSLSSYGAVRSTSILSADENPRANTLRVTEMLGEDAVRGRGLNKSALTRLNLGEWSKDMTIHGKTEKTPSQPKTDKS